jgi:hypothetical protein
MRSAINRYRQSGLLLLLSAAAITPAMAVQVTYSTTGTFSTGGGTTNLSNVSNQYSDANGLSITYVSENDLYVDSPPPTAINLGFILVSGPASAGTDTVSDAFTLNIVQSTPTAGPESVTDGSSNLSGTITYSGSGVTVKFAPFAGQALSSNPITNASSVSFVIGGVTYYVDAVTQLDPASVGGLTELQGAVSAAAPEPAFYGLTGVGFAGLMLTAIRRRRQGQFS